MKTPSKKICYNNLWKLLIDKKMTRKQLRTLTELSTATLSKLARGENVNTAVLLCICEALNCEISDIATIVDIDQ